MMDIAYPKIYKLIFPNISAKFWNFPISAKLTFFGLNLRFFCFPLFLPWCIYSSCFSTYWTQGTLCMNFLLQYTDSSPIAIGMGMFRRFTCANPQMNILLLKSLNCRKIEPKSLQNPSVVQNPSKFSGCAPACWSIGNSWLLIVDYFQCSNYCSKRYMLIGYVLCYVLIGYVLCCVLISYVLCYVFISYVLHHVFIRCVMLSPTEYYYALSCILKKPR